MEAYIPAAGRSIQGATSHGLGQNFSKMFNIEFTDESGEKAHVWQNSWGLTTRTIGVMVMVHGDDKGLVLPPRVSPLQCVIVPINKKSDAAEVTVAIDTNCRAMEESLKAVGVRVKYDNRDNYNPGWKYAHWEQKGVPVRIEVGPRDVQQGSAMLVRRDGRGKQSVQVDATFGPLVAELMETIQVRDDTERRYLGPTVREYEGPTTQYAILSVQWGYLELFFLFQTP